MSTSLLIHPTGASLISLSKTSAITAQTPLALASRFPKNIAPSAVVSPVTGHVFLWSKSSMVVWEYDARARRISEFSAGPKVEAMTWTMGENGKDGVVLNVGGEVKMMEKEGGKWDCVRTISLPSPVVALCSSRNGEYIGMINKAGDLSVYNRKNEVRRTVAIPKVNGEINPGLMQFAPSLPCTIVLPTAFSLLLVDAETHGVTEVIPSDSQKRILDLAFSPVVEGSDGKRRGVLCGVLLEGGEVALLGLDQPDSAPKTIDFGQSVVGVSFLDASTISGHTSSGNLLIKDLRALSDAPVEVDITDRVVGIHPLPPISRSTSRASLANTGASIKRTPFGESHATNLPTPPPMPTMDKGKGKAREIGRTVSTSETEIIQTAEIHIPLTNGERRASHSSVPTKSALKNRASAPPEPSDKARNVSAPTSSTSHLRTSSSRARVSLSGTTARSASEGNLASTSRTAPRSSTLAGLAEVIEEEDEGTLREGEEETREEERLHWALTSPASRLPTMALAVAIPGGSEKDAPPAQVVEDLRRDMWGLHMDMLRMNRALKNESRNAVEPLKIELEQSRTVIEAQRREIERLRRGY